MDMTSASPPFERIGALRRARGETLEAFGAAIGIASKGRLSEIERGIRMPTPEQAVAIERISGGAIDAAELNDVVRMARHAAANTTGGPALSTGKCGETSSHNDCGASLADGSANVAEGGEVGNPPAGLPAGGLAA